jgi:hypothetical protein
MLHAQHSIHLLQIYMDTHASERQISLQWQGLASSRDDRDVLRLSVLLGSQVRKLADSRRGRCILKLEQDQHPAHL